ncbi:hypothetical protein [uncultured Tateyamaria sp.]|uniref:hypothetical protein n=1 Tax=Tateyamaria sp. 1078 TaxID=3417464 RepID=UPI00261957A4|nr:hypothetical protein [uncultured Tateyamaria sp.]
MTFSEFVATFVTPGKEALAIAVAICAPIAALDGAAKLRTRLSAYFERTEDVSWQEGFIDRFDQWFGRSFLSFKGFFWSSAISLLSVLIVSVTLWIYLPARVFWTNPDPDMFKFVIIGALINILPDYLSLRLTRVWIGLMARYRAFWAQVILIAVDLGSSAFIIWSSLTVVRYFRGEPGISILEMAVLFSPYSAYFYSTFTTSLAALVFFFVIAARRLVLSYVARLGTVFARKSIDPNLSRQKAPFRVLAVSLFFVTLLLFYAALVAVSPSPSGVTKLDEFLCDKSGERLCLYATRLSPDDASRLVMLRRACHGTLTLECVANAEAIIDVPRPKMERLMSYACDLEEPDGCLVAGRMAFVAGDNASGGTYFGRACDLGERSACIVARQTDPGSNGPSSQSNGPRLAQLELSCDDGGGVECAQASRLMMEIEDSLSDAAFNRMHQACDLGLAAACAEIGLWYLQGVRGDVDVARGRAFIAYGCASGAAEGCMRLVTVWMSEGFQNPVQVDLAVLMTRSACAGRHELGCDVFTRIVPSHGESGGETMIEALRAILLEDPDNHVARRRFLDILITAGDFQAAESELRKGLRRPGAEGVFGDVEQRLKDDRQGN